MPSNISWFRSIAHYGLEFSRSRLQEVTGVVTGQGRFCFDSNRLLSPLLFSTLIDLNIVFRPGTTVAGRKDSLVHRKRNLFVFSVLSRTFSIPSVSGPVYQICGYHINCLISDTLCKPSAHEKLKFPMAVASSNVAIGDCIVHKLVSRCTHHRSSKYNVSTYYREKSFDCCFSVSMNSKSREKPDHVSIFGYFLYNAIRTSYKPYLWSWSDSKELDSLLASTLMGTAPDGFFNSSLLEVQQGNAIASSKGAVLSDTSLKLLSGSCCMPHPDKEESGGEDAHFICSEAQAIGVADGVGGWAELGVDAGQYARELMSNAVTAVREEPKGSIDPARVLEKAHLSTKVKGSSTACIIALTDQGLHAINLGDSGFIVVRDGCTVFRSPVQQHGFNFTFQLESGDAGDLPSSGQEFSVPVAPGDVIIAGTDGLFDNLYSNEVTEVVVQALRTSLGPEATAQKIAALARQRAQDRNRQTPFSTAAQDAGFQYYGGKLDDITVVVSYITSCNKEDDTLPPQASS